MSKRLLFNNVGGVPIPPPTIPDMYKTFGNLTPCIFKNTKEGEMQEVEILGNTWQDSNNNIFNGKLEIGSIDHNSGNNDNANKKSYRCKDYIKIKQDFEYSISESEVLIFYDINKKFIKSDTSKNLIFKTPIDCQYIRFRSFNSRDTVTPDLTLNDIKNKNIVIKENRIIDYSNIKHLGELQPDGKYKIDVESSNGYLDISKLKWNRGDMNVQNGKFELTDSETFNRFHSSTYLEVRENQLYSINLNLNSYSVNLDAIFYYNKDYKYIGFIEKTKIKEFITPSETKYIIIRSSCLLENYEKVKNSISIAIGNVVFEEFKKINSLISIQSLLLDQPLMSIGDVRDRLFYDKSKGEYVIEKKIDIPQGTNELITDKFIMSNPQLIPTSVKEEMKLNSYNMFTHCLVDGGIYGGIKAAVPIYTGVIELPITTEGSGKYLGNYEFEITDTTKWDNVSYLANPDTVLRIGQKYNLKLTILAKDIKEGATLQQLSTWRITHKNEIISVRTENMNVGDVFTSDFEIFNLEVGKSARVIGFQFTTANTGSYFKWRAEIKEVI